MSTLITAVVLLVIVGFALRYVIKAKKNGHKCIGCPNGCCPSQGKADGCTCGDRKH